MNKHQRETTKFWGKFFVYVGQVSAIISAIKLSSIEYTAISIFIIFIGCVMHEFSE